MSEEEGTEMQHPWAVGCCCYGGNGSGLTQPMVEDTYRSPAKKKGRAWTVWKMPRGGSGLQRRVMIERNSKKRCHADALGSSERCDRADGKIAKRAALEVAATEHFVNKSTEPDTAKMERADDVDTENEKLSQTEVKRRQQN